MNNGISCLVLRGADADTIKAQAIKEGMVSMGHDEMLKVKAGFTIPYEMIHLESVNPRFPAEAALYLAIQDKCSHAAGSRAWEPALLRIWIH